MAQEEQNCENRSTTTTERACAPGTLNCIKQGSCPNFATCDCVVVETHGGGGDGGPGAPEEPELPGGFY
jgi:hypothetical protein